MKKKLLLIILPLFLITLSILVFAGTLTPTVSNTTTGSLYTINDIYNFVKNNTTPGTHNVTTSSSPTATTSISVSQLYITLANLIDPKYIITGTSVLGVTGDFASTTSLVNTLSASSSSLSPFSYNSHYSYSLEDVWNLIQNTTTTPSVRTTTSNNPFSVTTHSLADIYTALTTLITPQTLKYQQSYLGVQGRAYSREVVHYKMNDMSGTTVVDSSGNGNNATALANTSSMTTSGKINTALSLTGTKINTPVISLGTSAVSFSWWFKVNSFSGDIKILFTSDNLGGVAVGGTSSGYPWTNGRLVSWSSVGQIIGTTNLSAGVWYYATLVSDGTTGELFLNGVSEGTSASTWAGLNDAIIIGSRTYDGEYNFLGSIDDFRIYNNVKLSQANINAIYNGGNGTESKQSFGVVSVPSTPTAPTASAGNTQATVTFTAPSSNGLAISGYTVTSIPAGGTDTNAGTTSLTHTITGLTNGTSYTFTVVATNGFGNSSASAQSNAIIPVVTCSSITDEPTCTGTSVCTSNTISCGSFDEGSCPSHSGCYVTYNTGASCTLLDETSCNTNANASLGCTAGYDSGNSDCSGFDESTCNSYSPQGCSAGYNSGNSECSNLGDEATCSSYTSLGCSVNYNSGSGDCSGFDEPTCNGTSGCSFSYDNSTCSGSYSYSTYSGCSGTYSYSTYNGCSGTYTQFTGCGGSYFSCTAI
jgi:hypothetical protein